ncbi:hypothetical protein CLOM_g20761 [Closterium sp. NIES-68]|nr:hypothetical protein CLOM_g20761 [Closterium sp. NIES-68]
MWEAVLPLRLLRGMELQGAAEEEGVGEAEAVGGALAEVEAEVTIMRGHGSSSGRGSTRMEGTCWYCKKVGHPWFKCFSRPEGWAPPGMKPPSGERAQGGAVQGSGAQGEGAQGNAYPGLFLMVEDVHGHEGDVGSVGKVVMHPLTHWVIDSGCTSHMTPRADLLDEVKPPGKIKYVAAASGALLPVIGVGNAKVKGANGELVGLGNVLLVEGLSANLLSVRRLQKSKAELPIIPWNGKTPTAATAAAAKATAGGDATAPTDGVLEAVKKVQQQQTHGEVLAGVDASAAWAKASSRSSRYFLTIVDDHTRAVWVYPLKSKGEVAAAVLKEWMPRAQRECGHKVKVIRSDNGGEFIGADFEGELKRKGIQHQLTVPYNPQQNGVAERFNRTLQEGARTLLGRAGLPDPFWVSALRQVALVKNRVLATVGDKEWIPYKLTVSRDVKFLESLYYKEWKQQQQKLPSTPLIVEADEVQQPSRQVEVAVSEEEMSGWKASEDEEFGSLIENETWDLCDLPPGKKAITSKMIYRHKYGPEGELTRYKSRLLEEALLAGGFKKSECDPSLFLLQEKDEILMLLVYVDDILLFSASTALLDSAEQMLEMQFKCSKMDS